MKNLLQRDKRGISVIIGYVLLVLLAVSMAGVIYGFLSFYVPRDQPQCEEGVSLIIRDMSCSGERINITLLNKGLFNIDGVYVKAGDPDRIFKETVNCPSGASDSECRIYFGQLNPFLLSQDPPGLQPGQEFFGSFNYTYSGFSYNPGDEREIEIEPVVFVGDEPALCNEAIATQKITCR